MAGNIFFPTKQSLMVFNESIPLFPRCPASAQGAMLKLSISSSCATRKRAVLRGPDGKHDLILAFVLTAGLSVAMPH